MKSAFFAAIENVEYAIPFKFRKLMAEYSHNRVLKLIDRIRNIYVYRKSEWHRVILS